MNRDSSLLGLGLIIASRQVCWLPKYIGHMGAVVDPTLQAGLVSKNEGLARSRRRCSVCQIEAGIGTPKQEVDTLALLSGIAGRIAQGSSGTSGRRNQRRKSPRSDPKRRSVIAPLIRQFEIRDSR